MLLQRAQHRNPRTYLPVKTRRRCNAPCVLTRRRCPRSANRCTAFRRTLSPRIPRSQRRIRFRWQAGKAPRARRNRLVPRRKHPHQRRNRQHHPKRPSQSVRPARTAAEKPPCNGTPRPHRSTKVPRPTNTAVSARPLPRSRPGREPVIPRRIPPHHRQNPGTGRRSNGALPAMPTTAIPTIRCNAAPAIPIGPWNPPSGWGARSPRSRSPLARWRKAIRPAARRLPPIRCRCRETSSVRRKRTPTAPSSATTHHSGRIVRPGTRTRNEPKTGRFPRKRPRCNVPRPRPRHPTRRNPPHLRTSRWPDRQRRRSTRPQRHRQRSRRLQPSNGRRCNA